MDPSTKDDQHELRLDTTQLMLIIFQVKTMPHLLEIILKYSAPFSTKPKEPSPLEKPTAPSLSQIQLACQHQNGIILNAVVIFITVQKIRNAIRDKLKFLDENQLKKIKDGIKTLTDRKIDSNEITNKITAILNKINTAKSSLDKVDKDLIAALKNLDEKIPDQEQTWINHWKEFFDKFEKELSEKVKLLLSDYEKTGFEFSPINQSNINEKKHKLEELKIKSPPNNPFATLAYYTIFTALHRTLKIGSDPDKSVKNVVNNLAVMKEENADFKKIKKEFLITYNKIKESIFKSEKKGQEITGPTNEEVDFIAHLVLTTIKKRELEEARKLAAQQSG